MLSGTDQGVYRWRPDVNRWVYLPSPLDDLQILQIAQSPHDADIIFAGTRPAQIYRSLDGGASWSRLELANLSECWFINTPRVTSIRFDPVEPETVWATIEIDGLYRTSDLGETWEKLNEGLVSDDTHNLVFFDDADARTLLISTEEGLHRSVDNGESWRLVEVPEAAPWVYMRCIERRADGSGVMFMSAGDRPSSDRGPAAQEPRPRPDLGGCRAARPGQLDDLVDRHQRGRPDADLLLHHHGSDLPLDRWRRDLAQDGPRARRAPHDRLAAQRGLTVAVKR